MIRALFVLSPLAVALSIFAWRESTRSAGAPLPEPGHAVELQMVRGSATPRRDLEYELDSSRSSVRFLVTVDGEERLFVCPPAAVTGRLFLAVEAAASTLNLQFDVGGVRAMASTADRGAGELWRLLGASTTADLSYAATLVSSATTPLPCLERKSWDGVLRFGARSVRQPMGLWQTALPGQPLRMQGHGTVVGETYGLRHSTMFLLFHEHNTVTLGLDLAWRRRTGR